MMTVAGDLALLLALFFSLVQFLAPSYGHFCNNRYARAFARPSAYGQAFTVILAYLLLTAAFVNNDFSIAYVAANSHPTLPLFYRLTAVWGAHEGSILLFILILNLWTLAIAIKIPKLQASLTLAILGALSFSFLLFLFVTSNPFVLLPQPMQTGQDLNPLLQDPGFLFHPPLLFMGYVGLVAAFALTLTALLRNELNITWARTTHAFALTAWCFLTLGIMLGSLWAYRVLGWGGFWFWDPVENASLLPWLSTTALIHVLLLVEKRGMAQMWAALLALIGFALSLLGTFLVRSGMLISAHTFASDPRRGVFLLAIFALFTVLALSIYMIRLPQLKLTTTPTRASLPALSFFSQEAHLLYNSALLCVAMLTILLGTLYPLILDALHLGAISVGAPYFNKVLMPLTFLLMALMGYSVFAHKEPQTLRLLWQHSWKYLLTSILCATLFLSYLNALSSLALIGLTLSLWVILSSLHPLRLSSMSLAHIGFAIFSMGIILSATLSQEQSTRLKIGETTELGPYQFHLEAFHGIQESNFRGIQADFKVSKHGRTITHLYPEKRIYTVRDTVLSKVAIHASIFRDLYLALGEPLADQSWTIRLYYKPFIRWIWLGALLMAGGGMLSILDHLRRQKIREQSFA